MVLRGKERHELSCSNCGAPLHALKMLPKVSDRATAPTATPARPKPKKRRAPREDRYERRPKKRKRASGFRRKLLSEIWDVLEDVVDEVFD